MRSFFGCILCCFLNLLQKRKRVPCNIVIGSLQKLLFIRESLHLIASQDFIFNNKAPGGFITGRGRKVLQTFPLRNNTEITSTSRPGYPAGSMLHLLVHILTYLYGFVKVFITQEEEKSRFVAWSLRRLLNNQRSATASGRPRGLLLYLDAYPFQKITAQFSPVFDRRLFRAM